MRKTQTKSLTKGKIRKRAGLDLKVKYKAHHGKNLYHEYGLRRDGTTTDMLVDVLQHLNEGHKCVIVAYSHAYAMDLGMRVRDLADKAGIDHAGLSVMGKSQYRKARTRNVKYFFDHYNMLDVVRWDYA